MLQVLTGLGSGGFMTDLVFYGGKFLLEGCVAVETNV